MTIHLNEKFLDNYFEDFIVVDHLDTVAQRIAALLRFCGEGVSVGIHCLQVAEYVRYEPYMQKHTKQAQWRSILNALMHDAHEAVISDIPKPIAELLNQNHSNTIVHLKEKVDLYLYDKCLPGLSEKERKSVYACKGPTEFADKQVLKEEYKWVTKWNRCQSTLETNLRIEDLIRKTNKDRKYGVFQDVKCKGHGGKPTDWCNRDNIARCWEEYVRLAVRNINLLEEDSESKGETS